MSADESADASLRRAEELLERVEDARARVEASSDPDAALEALSALVEIAKEVEAELARAKRAAEAEADADA